MLMPVIIDCDPGVDDALALLLAFASPEIDIIGITSVAGNVSESLTTANALRVCELGGRDTIPVYAGCPRPLLYPHRDGAPIHGEDGLGNSRLKLPARSAQSQHAVDFLIREIRARPGEITLAVLGPMTNIATALAMAPDIAVKIKQLVFMGGAAYVAGNVTSQAEFNFWFDPHAAQAVLASDIKMVMLGLDVTHQTCVTSEWIEQLSTTSKVGEIVGRMLASMKGGAYLHDPCVIAYLTHPDLFSGQMGFCQVECESPLSIGRSIVALSPRHLGNQQPNCLVIDKVDDQKLFALVLERLQRI